MVGQQLIRGLPDWQGIADRKRHCPIVLKDKTGSDRETGRAPASHAGNWLLAWETPQHETRFFIPDTQTLLPFLFLFSSPPHILREVLITAAAPHPVSIHERPGRPIRGLKVYNCMAGIVWVCVKVSFR